MAYTGTITTEAEIAVMAGENVDATGDTEANRNVLVAQAESYISSLIHEDVVSGFSGYGANFKQILSEYASRYVGMCLIAYNMAGYTSRVEAEDLINIHLNRLESIREILMDEKALTAMGVS